MTKARTLAAFNTTSIPASVLTGTLPALNGSALTNIEALNTKIITGTYSSDSTAAITTASLGFEAKHVICRFQLNDNSDSEAVHNMSFGNATKVDATTSAYACSYDYFQQHAAEAYDPVTDCMGRLAYGGGLFNNLTVTAWGADTITLTPVRLGSTPVKTLRYQLIIQG
jgi:hypothetical protein